MAEPNELAADLDRIVGRARAALRGWMWRRAVEKGVAALFPATLLVPLLVLCASLSELLTGRRLWPFDAVPSVAFAVALPLAVVAVACVVAYLRQRTCREVALNLYDRHLNCKDRLVTADELSRIEPRSGFERAAIDDARACAQRALAAAPPTVAWRSPTLRPQRWPLGVVAALALTAGLLLEGKTLAFANATNATGEAIGVPAAAMSLAEAHPEALPDHLELEANQTAPRPAVRSQPGGIAQPSMLDPSVNAEGFGASGMPLQQPAMRAAVAQSGQAGSAVPGASGQGKEETRRKAGEPKAQQQRQRPENTATPPREGASSSVAGGSGNSSGSRLASSDHPFSADSAGGEESLDAAADAAEDEEDETQEAASSRSPALVSRKAPVDRSLTLSADGDQNRDELNGRGGPSGLKKTRGVAAMLLGLPMSDHLGGEPNPGRVKIRKERAAPEEKAVARVDAAPRGSRDEAFGDMNHIRLPQWARKTVRDFFLAQRSKPQGVSEP